MRQKLPALCVALVLSLFATPQACAQTDTSLSTLKIAPPPAGGIYLGQYEWQAGDIAAVEQAAGIKTAFYAPTYGTWSGGYVKGHPHLELADANAAWDAGRAIVVQAYNTYAGPDDEHPSGFTVDKLLLGKYDKQLSVFAAELRAFGKPVFFQAGREPNGAGEDYFGGFGPYGDKSLAWAISKQQAYNKFTPPRPPRGAPATLYSGIGSATVCDGVERLKAAQRYYHDFFVRREGLKFLTFDTMGWAVRQPGQNGWDAEDYPEAQRAYARQVIDNCQDFKNFYPGDAYVDWVSINWYMLDYYQKDWPGFTQDYMLSNQSWIDALDVLMKDVQHVASTKPVLITELGFPDGLNRDSSLAADKLRDGFNAILGSYPQIRGVALWSNHPSWMEAGNFPYHCLIEPGTEQGTALKEAIASHTEKFHSCVYLTNGQKHPQCNEE